jgi:hypothetical protein
MLLAVDWQPFQSYGITIFWKKSQQEYMALEKKRNGFGQTYHEIIAQDPLEAMLRCAVEDYIIENKLRPGKLDEEDIL